MACGWAAVARTRPLATPESARAWPSVATQTPAAGGPRRFSTPMGQGAVDNQRGPPRNAPPSALRLAFQTPQ